MWKLLLLPDLLFAAIIGVLIGLHYMQRNREQLRTANDTLRLLVEGFAMMVVGAVVSFIGTIGLTILVLYLLAK